MHEMRRQPRQPRVLGGLAHDDAGGVQPDAGIALAFEHAHAQAVVGRRQRAGRTGEAGADDDEIEVGPHAHSLRLRDGRGAVCR
jgi:hypothetical protein